MNPNQGAQILVVEDDQNDSFLLTRQIAKAQIDDHVTVIASGEKAFDFLLKLSNPPIVIFLDLKLPGLSGIELLKRIRQEPQLQAIPVVVMTGSIDPSDVAECNRLGVTAFLPKPIGLTTFIKTVAHLFPEATVPD